MPVIGCYDLRVTCDNATHERWAIPEAEFVGDERGSRARQRARHAGWLLGTDGSALCPSCRQQGVRLAKALGGGT